MITQKLLKELFDYSDGNLIIHRTGELLKWSKRNRQAKLLGERHLIHRLIWLWHYGELPKYIDHINRNPFDHRIENLRQIDHSLNAANAKLRVNNTSGYKGITKYGNKWRAQIGYKGKVYGLGYFDNIEDAIKHRKFAAESLFGEHINHGDKL